MSKRATLKEQIRQLEHELEHEVEEVYHTVDDFIQEKWHHKLHRKAKHHVHRLRQKPEHHKKAVAFGVSFGVTAIVFLFWYFITVPQVMHDYRVDRDQSARLRESTNPVDDFKSMYEERKALDEAGNSASAIEAFE
jgi:hypothetical protein